MISIKELHTLLNAPTAFLLLTTAILLTLLTRFAQLRKFKQFAKVLTSKQLTESEQNTISPMQALFTAMSTSLGMGTIVAPSLAITIGGPGALFWIMVYAVLGCVTKYAEVIFAVKFKRYSNDGTIIGGPTAYLSLVHPFLAKWYGLLTVFLFSSWSALQAKTIALTYAHYGVPEYVTGLLTATFVVYMLFGGIKAIGDFSSKLVPVMCLFYFIASGMIIFANFEVLKAALLSIFTHAFNPTAPIGGFAGATMFTAFSQGMFKAAFVTEAGVGTAGIAHSLANTKNPIDQGVLAMYSMIFDTFFCVLSGLITLVTGVWTLGVISNDLPLLSFKSALPSFGPIALTITITLFVIGTAVGNSLNGSKSYAFFTNNRWMKPYYIFVGLCLFAGSILHTPTLWDIAEIILPLVIIPNIIGLLILAFKYRKELSA